MSTIIAALARALESRRRAVVAVLAVITIALAAGLPRLEFETSQRTLVNESSQVYQDNLRYQGQFGGEPMLTVYSGDVTELFTEANLPTLEALEAALRETGRFHAVLGPLTALRFAEAQLAVAPEMLMRAPDGQQRLVEEATRLGTVGEHELTNPKFVEFLLFGSDGTIRPILRDNFPDPEHALLLVRLPGNATIAELGPGSDEVRRLVAAHPLDGFDVVSGGPPTLLQEINDDLQGGMASLGLFAAVVMVVVLFAVFRVRRRLVGLVAVALGAVWAFGAIGYLGIPLTMVTISGLPILVGLGVDFAIQVHNRYEEERVRGDAHPVRPALLTMAPPLLVVMVAAVVGFAALQMSRVPMIRDFGVMLAVGTVALILSALAVPVLLVGGHTPARQDRHGRGLLERGVHTVTATRLPALAVFAVAILIVPAGLYLEGQTDIQTDPEKWVAADSAAVQDLVEIREGTGFSTELGLLVEADDVTSDEVAGWMQQYTEEQVAKHEGKLIRGTSLAAIASSVTGARPTAADMDAILSVAPDDVRRSFVSDDGRRANLIFPIANMTLTERDALLDDMRADLDPPTGVTVTASGLVVLGIELVHGLEANRTAMPIAASAFVALWLLIVYRKPILVIAPLVPVLLAVGVSAAALWLLSIELTPLTTVSGPLVIAVTTEFSVLVMARFREECQAGRSPRDAVTIGCDRIGRAFAASGLTLIGGFAVLMLSPLPLLVDFGIVVVLNVAIALASTLVVLPSLLEWSETRHATRAARVAVAPPTARTQGA